MLSLDSLGALTARNGVEENKKHFWSNDPSILLAPAETSLADFTVGSALDIYTSTILPALESAQNEILFVTCFWSHSQSLAKLCSTLVKLSNRHSTSKPKLRVRLCFSSRSLTQKLFHTSSETGYIYPPSKWRSLLGLPPPEDLEGLDLQVKSLFVLPFCVMHPKFIIIDQQRVLLPSCNLSWESWLECCIPLAGPIVTSFVQFWRHTWGRNDWVDLPPPTPCKNISTLTAHRAVFLPSPYHRNPRFRLLPSMRFAPPPPTPLNVLLLHIFSIAQEDIVLLTPNLTSPPVISALLEALYRGVNVTVITNRRMMIPEQLVTSGTITELSVWKLRRCYNRMCHQRKTPRYFEEVEDGVDARDVGILRTGYYLPTAGYKRTHIKCSTIDSRVVVLGSGNMDRASWYTSQELGVAIEGKEVVKGVWTAIEGTFAEEIWRDIDWL